MVKIILSCWSYSPQANVLIDNVAPTYQGVSTKTQANAKIEI